MSDARPVRHPSDAWVSCRCGSRHWGLVGAAGLLLADDVPATRVVLQHRALWSHHGGTWGLPGGALLPGESAVAGAVRESAEEAGIDPAAVRPHATWTLTHPDWSYTTVLGRAARPLEPRATDAESLEVAWVPVADVDALPLLPAFADAWPTLRAMLDVRPVLVVDGANVVGSRPDGWWRDRAGASTRLRDALDARAADGVPADLLGLRGDTWWPQVVLVTEGAGRGPVSTPTTRVVAATGSGDDAVVSLVEDLAGRDVTVVTADRALTARVTRLGARTTGPRRFRV